MKRFEEEKEKLGRIGYVSYFSARGWAPGGGDVFLKNAKGGSLRRAGVG